MRKPAGADLSFPQLVEAMNYKLRNTTDSERSLSSVSDIDTVVKHLHVTIALLQGRRNALVPVHRLAPELLSYVFREIQPVITSFLPTLSIPKKHYLKDFASLLQVCRHWRGVIASAYNLWSIIDSDNRSAISHLKRSKAAPLTAYLGINTSEELLNAILNESHRIRELHCQPDDFLSLQTPFLDLLKEHPMPALESLSISGTRDPSGWGLVLNPSTFTSATLPPIFDDGKMPKLKRLCLMCFSSWPSGYFTSLTHLCLHDQLGIISMYQLLDFLELSPELEELVLVRFGPMSPGSEVLPVAPSRRLSFDRLKRLELGDWMNLSSISRFLTHLRIPASASTFFWGAEIAEPFETLDMLFPSDTSHLLPLTTLTEVVLLRGTVRLQDGYNQRFSYVYIHDGVLQIYGGQMTASQLAPVFATLEPWQVKKFTVYDACPRYKISSEMWASMFSHMHALESLDIRSYSPEGTGVIRSMLTSLRKRHEKDDVGDGGGKKTFLLPSLKHLGIQVKDHVPQLIITTFARERAKCGRPIRSMQINISTADEEVHTPLITGSGFAFTFELSAGARSPRRHRHHHHPSRSLGSESDSGGDESPDRRSLQEEDAALLRKYVGGKGLKIAIEKDDRKFPKITTIMWDSVGLKWTRPGYVLYSPRSWLTGDDSWP